MPTCRLLPALAMLAAACGATGDRRVDLGGADGAVAVDLGATDLAVAAADLAKSPDLAPPGCAQMLACTRACHDNGACVAACIQAGSPEAMVWFNPLAQCAGPACTSGDAAAAPCTDPSSQECLACVMQFCGKQLADCQAH